jgi:hypothetical protein
MPKSNTWRMISTASEGLSPMFVRWYCYSRQSLCSALAASIIVFSSHGTFGGT